MKTLHRQLNKLQCASTTQPTIAEKRSKHMK